MDAETQEKCRKSAQAVLNYFSPTINVMTEVVGERMRQHNLWGRQDFKDGTGDLFTAASHILPPKAAQSACEDKVAQGRLTFADVLLEEVAEVLHETDEAHLREELIQVAAVAIQWVEAIDRRRQT